MPKLPILRSQKEWKSISETILGLRYWNKSKSRIFEWFLSYTVEVDEHRYQNCGELRAKEIYREIPNQGWLKHLRYVKNSNENFS